MERITNQREVIRDYLRSVEIHPTAEKVYEEVKKKLPRISLGTVYRNLEYLKKKGELQEIATETKRFDGDVTDHQHFVCQKCGKVFDIDIKIRHRMDRKKINRVGLVNLAQLYLYGVCNSCSKGKAVKNKRRQKIVHLSQF